MKTATGMFIGGVLVWTSFAEATPLTDITWRITDLGALGSTMVDAVKINENGLIFGNSTNVNVSGPVQMNLITDESRSFTRSFNNRFTEFVSSHSSTPPTPTFSQFAGHPVELDDSNRVISGSTNFFAPEGNTIGTLPFVSLPNSYGGAKNNSSGTFLFAPQESGDNFVIARESNPTDLIELDQPSYNPSKGILRIADVSESEKIAGVLTTETQVGGRTVVQTQTIRWDSPTSSPELLSANNFTPRDINSSGDIVGSGEVFSLPLPTTANKPVIWKGNSNTAELLELPSDFGAAIAHAINDEGIVVGHSRTSVSASTSSKSDAVAWENGNVVSLDTLISDSSWDLLGAYDINSSGQIVGSGLHNGIQTAFLLEPEDQGSGGGGMPSAQTLFLNFGSPDETETVIFDVSRITNTFKGIIGFEEEQISYDHSDIFNDPNLSILQGFSRQTFIDQVTAQVAIDFQDFGIDVVNSRPSDGEFSTIFLSSFISDNFGTDLHEITGCGDLANLLGCAEDIDIGNDTRNDNAIVYVPNHQTVTELANTVSHEAGHLLGLRHVADNSQIMADGRANTDREFGGKSDVTGVLIGRITLDSECGLKLVTGQDVGSVCAETFFGYEGGAPLDINLLNDLILFAQLGATLFDPVLVIFSGDDTLLPTTLTLEDIQPGEAISLVVPGGATMWALVAASEKNGPQDIVSSSISLTGGPNGIKDILSQFPETSSSSKSVSLFRLDQVQGNSTIGNIALYSVNSTMVPEPPTFLIFSVCAIILIVKLRTRSTDATGL